MISTIELDELMRRGWPATRETTVDGWLARFSGEVTRRANSVLPFHSPSDLEEAIGRVEELYHCRGLPPTFQIGPATRPSGLDAVLARRGYELRTPTVVLVAAIEEVPHPLSGTGPEIRVRHRPDTTWTELWWEVDGRGGVGSRAIAHEILTGVPALYASREDRHGVAAVGRLALVGSWAGLYCMAVRPDARRRGHASAILRGLLDRAAECGSKYAWLQVTTDNHAARSLYERAGFRQASHYHYRELPTKRFRSG
ncbi:GNAT family N-acetyltransferase [Actinopolyspora erythraea]|uniref:GNAT family N-acetyltransferase n=1 Tax=Actinopolyspora erythraea TaxID=414996 RepID=UPI0011871345|nr:GNAT family N-acetyltransferase [Actinopolyspora erythraea]